MVEHGPARPSPRCLVVHCLIFSARAAPFRFELRSWWMSAPLNSGGSIMSSRTQAGVVVIAMAVGAVSFALMLALRSPPGPVSGGPRDADEPEAPWVGPSVETADLKLSGPYPHGNLSVFLVHGPDRLAGKNFMTLQEALEAKKAVVYETGNVNQLTVENLSKDEELFIQSGDIVKGGQQDRTLEYD